MDQLPAFEVRAIGESGDFEDSVVLGRIFETEADAIAQDYADLWGRKVALTIVPDVDDGCNHTGWQKDQIQVVKEFNGRRISPTERRLILRRCYAWQSDEQFEAMHPPLADFKERPGLVPASSRLDSLGD